MTVPEDKLPKFPMMFNGNGIQGADEDECVEDTYFRLIIESEFFHTMDDDPEDQELFMLLLGQACIDWVVRRKGDY